MPCKPFPRSAGTVVLTGIAVVSIHSQPWQDIGGPIGAHVKRLVFTDDKIFAAAAGGVYHSRNSGAFWMRTGTGIDGVAIGSLAAMGSSLYAGGAAVTTLVGFSGRDERMNC